MFTIMRAENVPYSKTLFSKLQLQGPTSAHTASRVVQATWRPAEDVGNHEQGRPETALRTQVFSYAR